MREIKFRCWNKSGPKMFNVDVLTINGPKGDGYIKTKGLRSNLPGCPIMQYSGLKDKNGKEIYEGDIVSNGKQKSKVVFRNGHFLCLSLKQEKLIWAMGFSMYTPEPFVIGNIYENPELLK